MNNEMKKELVSFRFLAITVILLFAVQLADCDAQRNATRRLEKETFGQSRHSSPAKVSGESRAAEKAMKEQERKQAKRDKEDAKQMKDLRERHYEIQSEETRARMENNTRATGEKYKAKRQKQSKEQIKPELNKPERPGSMKASVKAATKDPVNRPEPRNVKSKAGTKDPAKQSVLKQNKSKAKSKMVDPKKQKRLKQHKIKKY